MKIKINFQKEKIGLYPKNRIKKVWNNPQIVTTSVKPTIVKDGNKNVLQLGFSKGKFGKEDKASWHINFKKSYEVLYCQYKVKFEKGFDWKLGGKLPGFGGGDKPGGGKQSKEGFSSRVMWREKGTMHQYVYYPENNAHYGKGFWWHNLCSNKIEQLKFKPGKWHTIKMKIKMNNNWKDPGHIISWLDGKLALYQYIDLREKNTKEYGVESFIFTVFFGGDDKSFAPRKDCKIYFDDFIISDKDIK
ncbi:MAG: hypothetical protein Q7S27_04760 [Nanoarchaeota archaeon]|nr:hypothetical protein [Nanoarchaeota archaeon]